MEDQAIVEGATPEIESDTEAPTSIMAQYIRQCEDLRFTLDKCSLDKIWKARAKFDQPLKTIKKECKQGFLVGNTAQFEEISRKFEEQKAVVQQIQEELTTQVAEHTAKLEKVAATLVEMFEPPKQEKVEVPVVPIKKKRVFRSDLDTSDVPPFLKISVDNDNDTYVPVSFKNTSKTLTFHIKVTHHNEICDVEPEFKVQAIPPGEKFELSLSYQYYYDCELADIPGGTIVNRNDLLEIAYTNELAGANTVWNFFWLPYELYV